MIDWSLLCVDTAVSYSIFSLSPPFDFHAKFGHNRYQVLYTRYYIYAYLEAHRPTLRTPPWITVTPMHKRDDDRLRLVVDTAVTYYFSQGDTEYMGCWYEVERAHGSLHDGRPYNINTYTLTVRTHITLDDRRPYTM